MYLCVAENAELLVFFLLFFYAPSPNIDTENNENQETPRFEIPQIWH